MDGVTAHLDATPTGWNWLCPECYTWTLFDHRDTRTSGISIHPRTGNYRVQCPECKETTQHTGNDFDPKPLEVAIVLRG